MAVTEKPSFFDLTLADLKTRLAGWNWPVFRAGQVFDWVYAKGISDPAQMTNLATGARERLATEVDFSLPDIVRRQSSSDGTEKLLVGWPDGATAETVMIPDADRRTACLSSQVGCPAGCRFCASGIGGLKQNLTPGRIVQQVYLLNRLLAPKHDHISNLVFMGMGEPLSNYNNVLQAVRVLHDPAGFELAGENLQLNLAISLHAPNETLRRELIPWAEHFALGDILEAARYYFERTGREITLEYILLAGVNDQAHHARELAELCRTLRCNVNLIRYNEVAELPFSRPHANDVIQFLQILRACGVNAHVRKSRGRDIDAACGQLRRKADSAKSLPVVQ